MTVDADKAALRLALQRQRDEAARLRPDAATALAARFPDHLVPPPGAAASGYVAFRSEIDPAPLLDRLARAGARIVLPRTPPKGVDGPLTFHVLPPGAALVRSGFGVAEPGADAEQAAPDLVLVPLLGFDRTGARLGYGKGHYDRTLAALRSAKRIVAVGLAFAEQEASHIPQTGTDQRLDWIVTPERAIKAG